MINILSTAALSFFWGFVSAEEIQPAARNTISIRTTPSQATAISYAISTSLPCSPDCHGFLEFQVVFAGTPISVDPASTTGPPNCEAFSPMGPGYYASVPGYYANGPENVEPALIQGRQDVQLPYSIHDGAHTLSVEPLNIRTQSIASNLVLDEDSGSTIACLSMLALTMYSYYLASKYLSQGVCTGNSVYLSFSTPIMFENLSFLTTSLSKTYLAPSILMEMAVTTCDIPTTLSASTSGADRCTELVYATMDVHAYWRGVQLTFDKDLVTTQPNCASALISLGPGFTGSSTFTTIIYKDGGFDLGTGTEMLSVPRYHPVPAPFSTMVDVGYKAFVASLLTIDSQTIGCLSSLHDVARDFTIITTYHACSKQPQSIARTITLSTPVTDTGSLPFMSEEGNGPMLIRDIATQLFDPNNHTVLVTSTTVSTLTSQWSVPSNYLDPLAEPSSALPQTTKIILTLTVGMAIALIIAFLTFFLWKRFSASHNQRGKPVQVSFAATRSAFGESYTIVQQDSTRKDLPVQKPKSWRAPLVMLSGVITGLAFAIGHYCFYNSLDQRALESVQISQSWVLRLGNLFAFAVKLSLAISVGVAFTQLQWVKLRQKPFRVKDIDALSGGLGNILSFTDSLVWFRHPLITLVALICWLLPIIPVIAPGTINVVSRSYSNHTYLEVPQLARNVSAWTTWLNFASSPLQRVVWSAAFGGNILPIQFDYTNASYHLDFLGPAVRCIYADSTLTIQAAQVLGRSLDSSDKPYFSYFSWIPVGEILYPDTFSCSTPSSSLDMMSKDRARIYILSNDGNSSAIPNVDANLSLVNLTECGLYNATYSVDFIFNNTRQLIVIQDVDYHNGIPYYPYGSLDNNVTQEYKDQASAYAGLMGLFGSLVLGYAQVDTSEPFVGCTKILETDVDLNLDSTGAITSPNSPEVLQRGIEELFRNMTISLLSKDVFIENDSEPVPVNLTINFLTYSFVPYGLVLTYGSATMVTIICSLFGFYAFLVNDGSYQNIFSTFVRATRNVEIVIQDGDTGSDPCPKDLGKALVDLTISRTSSPQPISRIREYLIPRKPVPTNQQQDRSI